MQGPTESYKIGSSVPLKCNSLPHVLGLISVIDELTVTF